MPPVTQSTTRRPRRAARASSDGVHGIEPWAGRRGRSATRRAARSARPSAAAARLGRERLVIDRLGLDLAGLDLLEGDRQRLARHRGDLRRDDLAEALAELVVVVVDLAGPHRGERHEGELRADAVEQPLHPRFHEVGAPFGHEGHSITWGKRAGQRSGCARVRRAVGRETPGHGRFATGLQDSSHLVDGSGQVVVDHDGVEVRRPGASSASAWSSRRSSTRRVDVRVPGEEPLALDLRGSAASRTPGPRREDRRGPPGPPGRRAPGSRRPRRRAAPRPGPSGVPFRSS